MPLIYRTTGMKVCAVLGILLLAAGCTAPEAPPRAKAADPVKILHFYGNQAQLPKGETLTLCYGTEGADKVAISPEVDGVGPALNRCVADKPTADTTYTLKANGPGGEATATFAVKIGPPAPMTARGPSRQMITSFNVLTAGKVAPGAPAQLCYTTDGATAVSLAPPAGQNLAPGKNVCFAVKPQKTTNYILTANAADGAVDRMQVTVAVQ